MLLTSEIHEILWWKNLPDSSQVMGNGQRGDDFSQDHLDSMDSMGMDDEESIPLISSH
jgi:hypothetical protein